ncbi:MAG: metal-dependent hydrolase [Pirellulaceae bacterium]
MSAKLQWLGHGSWLIECKGHRLLLDPFLNDNPSAKMKADELDNIGHILVSHGHADHVGDTASIAKRCQSQVLAMVEVAGWLESQGVANTVGMNLGGSFSLPFGAVQMVPALHSSSMPDGSYGGNPAGFVFTFDHTRIYFACDTALFSDMQLIGRKGIDTAILPIGDHYTMGPRDSVEAIKLIRPRQVLPAHYNTWPVISQDAAAWARLVTSETDAKPVVLQVNDTLEL